MTKELVPIIHDHDLPSGSSIKLTRFSFRSKLASPLLNEDLMRTENLLIDPDNPYRRPSSNQVLGDINTGWWYRETFDEICTKPWEVLLPILLFIDGGKVTKRMSVEPIVFTLGIFNRATRNVASAWRTLGYIENLENSDAEDVSILDSRKKLNDYHSMVNVILKEFKDLQGKDKGFQWELSMNGKQFPVIFKIALQVIIGDCQGLDKVCGQFGSHHPLMKKLCRDCFVTPSQSDDPYHICKFVKMDDIIGKNKKQLKDMSMHCIDNAFSDIYFGARTLSVYQCTPPEPLHGILLGTFKYAYEQFEKEASKNTIKLINKAIRHFYREFSKQSSRGFPTLSHVQNGINECGVLSAKEQYGRMFGIYLSLLVPEIFTSLSNEERKMLADPNDSSKGFSTIMGMGKSRAEKWFMIIESSLTMYQWLMNPYHPPHTVKNSINRNGEVIQLRAEKLLHQYMFDLKYLVGNRKGNGLRIVKFHQILHYVPQILKDGSILNVDSGRCESNAVTMYKLNARLTQRRQKLLTRQISQRHVEDLIMDEAQRVAEKKCPGFQLSSNVISNIEGSSNQGFHGSKYSLFLQTQNIENNEQYSSKVVLKWNNPRTKARFNTNLNLHIAKRLFFNPMDGGCLTHSSVARGYTEYQDDNGNLYRAHPNYKNDGQWYDWCQIKWEGIEDPLPAKIIVFLDLTSCNLMNVNMQRDLGHWLNDEYDLGEFLHNSNSNDESNHIDRSRRGMKEEFLTLSKWAVICSSEDHPNYVNDNGLGTFAMVSKISGRFTCENKCRMVPIESIVAPCYCIPMSLSSNDTKCKDFVIVEDMDLWSEAFLPEE